MYDKYLIVGELFKNIIEGGQITGYQLGIRLPYYRGVPLSLVGETILRVDGQQASPAAMTVTLQGKTYPLAQLEDEPVAKWEFGDIGLVQVRQPGGLPPGQHQVELRQHMKISYVPGGFWGGDRKTLTLLD